MPGLLASSRIGRGYTEAVQLRTVGSLQELGNLLGGSGSVCSPASSGETMDCDAHCNGRIYMVDNDLVGIPKSTWGHPGILCRWVENVGLVSIGTDMMKLSYKDLSNYFLVYPTQRNGLSKPTGFNRSLARISEASLAPLSILGYLERGDCRTCVSNTTHQRAHNR